MKKSILFLLNRECTYLPPFLAILDSLCEDYSLKVISYEKKGGLKKLEKLYEGRDVNFLCRIIQDNSMALIDRIGRKFRKMIHSTSPFKKEALRLLNKTSFDLLWVINEETAFEFRKELEGRRYIVSLHELNGFRRNFLDAIRPVLQNAQEVLVPEYNRACILRVWLNLLQTPTVVPNKPFVHPRKRYLPNLYQKQLEGKKILLYQGYINRSRNLDKVCEAMKDMPDYCIVLMGKGDESYIKEIKKNYPQITHIPFIDPPAHLLVTSWARIAIVKYDFVALNAIFCAPNKTWEYTGFGIPVLCHDIPGLRYTIGGYEAGMCTDMDDVEAIKKAIIKIDANYNYYSRNAEQYYDSFDLKSKLNEIVNRNTVSG